MEIFKFILTFQERKIDLKENLIMELEDKKKNIENERLTMELTGGKPYCLCFRLTKVMD